MALPGQAGRNYRSMMSGAKRGAFARSPSAAKRGVFAQSPSAAKKGVFGFTPGLQKSTSPTLGSFRSTPGGGYTPGGDSFKNYSVEDQQKMFQQAGGKDKFIDQVAEIEQKYKRSADIQRFLDRTNLFNKFQNRGDGIVKDAQGRTILSMQSPYLTAQSPTLGQLFGDMTRAAGSMIGGFAEKGGPIMNFAKDLVGGIQNFFSPLNPVPAVKTGVENLQSGFNDFMQSGQNFNMLLMALPPEQRRIYDLEIMKPGVTREQAYRTAKGIRRMAMGGVANL